MSKYYENTVKEALEDAKITATQEQIDVVINWVISAVENESTARGHDVIPNPINSEIETLKAKHKKEIMELENKISIFRKSVADRRNVSESDVYLEDGRVMYRETP